MNWPLKLHVLLLTLCLLHLFTRSLANDKDAQSEECLTPNTIEDWKRSAGHETTNSDPLICDSLMIHQWYRVKGQAGEKMPTQCVDGGFRCSTNMPCWLTNISVPAKEDIYPAQNVKVSRIVCCSHYSGDCCKYNVTIEIKNCTNHLVYKLPPTPICPTGYCFGQETPCPVGQYSENGFSPGCGTFPNDTIHPKPKVTTGFHREETQKEIFQRVKFQCNANIDMKYRIDVRWYINKKEIQQAFYRNILPDKLNDAFLNQKHWENDYKPNMNVSCSIQLRQPGFQSPGPPQFSDEFFAGIIIDFKEEHKILVEGGPPQNISARSTIPIGCSYPSSGNNILSAQKECAVNLLGAVPDYQQYGKCNEEKDGLQFIAEQCGIYFNFTHWNYSQIISVSGKADGQVNVKNRIMYLRLYIDASKDSSDKEVLRFWKGFALPDLIFAIQDTDYITLHATCSSDNDPHMRTFDGKTYDFHLKEGEYIMYKHNDFPIEIHSYYQKCAYKSNTGPLCNCGAAVRSGDSHFIANFCDVKSSQNRYAIQKICDEQDMSVSGGSNKYTIQTMSGTKVILVFGAVTSYGFYGLHTFQVVGSSMDRKLVRGLCGNFDDDPSNDMIPRNQETAVGDGESFAESYRLKDDEIEDTLFDIQNIKFLKQKAKPYCTCKKTADDFPWGLPEFTCNYTQSIDACSRLIVKNKVYKTPCKKDHLRTKRDTSYVKYDPPASYKDNIERVKRGTDSIKRHRRDVIELEDDDAPVMYAMDITSGASSPADLSWKNGWTENKARQHCIDAFHASSSFSVCDSHVKAVPSDTYIDKCIADIQLAGEAGWVDVNINNFATACLQVASRIENLTQSNETTSSGEELSIFDIIQKATCPKNCSGNGICVEGQCVCKEPFFGPTCEVERTQAPTLALRAFNGLCDTSIKPCHKYIIPGQNFNEGNLTCKYRHFMIDYNETTETGISETAEGIYYSPFTMQCPAPASRHKRSLTEETSAFGYFISVSNDGKNFTEDLTVIVYDSTCFQCSTENLTCVAVETCPHFTSERDVKSDTGSYIGAGIGGAMIVVVLLIVFLFIKKKVLKKRAAVKDSTVSIPGRNVTGKSSASFQLKLEAT